MNPFDIVKNLGDLQSHLQEAQDKLGDVEATGSAGGNMVRVTLNGKFQLVDIKLDPICVDSRDVQMLEDLIKAAYRDAHMKVQEKIRTDLSPMLTDMRDAGIV